MRSGACLREADEDVDGLGTGNLVSLHPLMLRCWPVDNPMGRWQVSILNCCAVILLFIAPVGCQDERINQLEKQNADLKAQMEKSHVALDYDLQVKCSKDARTWFNENWRSDKDTLLLDFSNRYDKATNQCFILVEHHFRSSDRDSSWTNNMSLWNVYENSQYGDFREAYIIDFKNPPKNELFTCTMLDTKCTSLDQFNSLVQPYMNN
jgi:hypothetical protein